MQELKDALYGALAGNVRLVTLLGTADGISWSWPALDAQYAQTPPGTNPLTLPPTATPRARIACRLITPLRDMDVPSRDDTFAIDVWSPNQRLVETIVAELERSLNEQPLELQRGRVTELLFARGPDLHESDTRLYRTASNLRVLWHPQP